MLPAVGMGPRGADDVTPTPADAVVIGAGIVIDGPHDAPLRGDMTPRSGPADSADPVGVPPPPGLAPLISSGQHQTHNLSQTLRHLAGLVGGLQKWPQSHQLTEDHVRLAGLLAASYTLGQTSCRRKAPPSGLEPAQAAMPVWVPAPAPVPALPAETPEDVETEKVAALISRRSADGALRPTLGRRWDRAGGDRTRGVLMDRMADLTADRPPAGAVVPIPTDRVTAMRLVEGIMERHRKALGVLYSEQRQQLDEQLRQQTQAIQHTFDVELKYVANILMAIDDQGRDETPPHEDDGDGEVDEVDLQDSEAGEEGGSGEADHKDVVAEEVGDPTVISGVGVTAATSPTPITANSGVITASTPFARSPRTAEPPQCPPFDEDAAREALISDSRVLMSSLLGIGLKLFQTVRPDEAPAGLSALPQQRTAGARSRAGRQMSRLVRAVAGSEVRFNFSLSLLEKHRAPLGRLHELLRAGAGRGGHEPAGTEYNLTTAITALSSCFINGVPGFQRWRRSWKGRWHSPGGDTGVGGPAGKRSTLFECPFQ